MKNQSRLSKHGIRYIIRICLQMLIQMAVILLAAGTFYIGRQLLIYFIILAGSYITEIYILILHNPEVLNERVKNIKAGTKSWDKILLSLYVVCTFIVMNIFIGLHIRFGWARMDLNYCYVGITLYILSVVISTKSLLTNKYFESSSRIQTEREQKVISTGVYAVIRHPGYSSIFIWAISVPLLTGTVYTFIPSTLIITIITLRTYLEDTMLKKELDGYLDYTRKVKYRLIPYLW
ncbi:MAG: isoprenylcysteine carboxylmethyltransferase family protein [Bacteroides sp.]|nr:isoprenylcysteine carboxylmethyltransferase family protein [Bacteroides sp.]